MNYFFEYNFEEQTLSLLCLKWEGYYLFQLYGDRVGWEDKNQNEALNFAMFKCNKYIKNFVFDIKYEECLSLKCGIAPYVF